MKKKFFVLIFFLPIVVNAQLFDNDELFLADDWSEGLHIFAGAGLNSSHYHSNNHKNYLGLGINFKADVGWYFNHDWALESSASVKFNKLDADLIWDTLLTLGLRYRIEEYYFRAFGGAGVLVIVIDENDVLGNNNTRRLHMDGPALGFGFGRTKKTKTGKIWFIELNTTAQLIKRRHEVAVDGQYPVAISSQPVNDNSTIYSLQFSVGGLLF